MLQPRVSLRSRVVAHLLTHRGLLAGEHTARPAAGRCSFPTRATYYSGKFVTQVAHNTAFAALVILTGMASHASAGLSGLFIAAVLPPLLFGLAGGSLVDRIGVRRGLVLGSILRFIVIAAAVPLVTDQRSAWVFAFAISAAAQVYTPASLALVRTIQRDAPGAAHASLATLQYAGQGVGLFVLAPVLYWLGGVQLMFIGAALLSALVMLISLHLARRLSGEPLEPAGDVCRRARLPEATRMLFTNPLTRYAVVVSACKVVVSRGIVIALPLYLNQDLHAGRSALGALIVPGVAGAIIGLISAGRIVTPARAGEVMRIALVGMAVAVAALAFFDNGIDAAARYSHLPPIESLDGWANTTYAVALPVAFLIGFVMSTSLISARVALTSSAPLEQQGRVFALQETVTEALLVVPVLGIGAIAELTGARITLAGLAALCVLAFLILEFAQALTTAPVLAAEAEPTLS